MQERGAKAEHEPQRHRGKPLAVNVASFSALDFEEQDGARMSKSNGNCPKVPGSGFSSASFLSMQYRIPTVALDEYEIDAAVIALVPKELCEVHRVLPVSRVGASLVLAMVDPIDGVAIGALKSHTGYNVEPVITTEAVIVEAITKYYG